MAILVLGFVLCVALTLSRAVCQLGHWKYGWVGRSWESEFYL